MAARLLGASGAGLERSCRPDWFRSRAAGDGVQLLQAWFAGHGYDPHRHDTYAIGLTDVGVQAFDYRGAAAYSTPGKVLVLHPDEVHDGRAASAEGFGYRIVYLAPALVAEAARALCGRPCALPFVREPVTRNPKLAHAIDWAFRATDEPLAADALVLHLTAGLLAADRSCRRAAAPRRLDRAGLARARQFLDSETGRVVRADELEAVSGLTRYDLARQFRAAFGTSPYRYSLLRRLDRAQARIRRGEALADVALAAGFADQAHFSRAFKAAHGLSPARFRALQAARNN